MKHPTHKDKLPKNVLKRSVEKLLWSGGLCVGGNGGWGGGMS